MKILKRFLMILMILLILGVATSCDNKSANKDKDNTQITPDDDKPNSGEDKNKEHTHTGGTATCKEQAICIICKEPYGALSNHQWKDGVCKICKEAQPKTKNKIVFYHTMGNSLQTVLDLAVQNFEAKYPEWEVEHIQAGGYDDVKSIALDDLKENKQPNIVYCYADHIPYYMPSGKLIDLTKYINSTDTMDVVLEVPVLDDQGNFVLDVFGNIVTESVTTKQSVGFTQEELSDFVQGYYAEGNAQNYTDFKKYGYTRDSMLSLPFVKATEVLYYNEDALKAAGITKKVNGQTVAAVPETWDELWDACAKLKAKYPNSTPLGYDSESNWFATMCEQNGWGYTSASAPHYLFNNENTEKWLNELKGYYKKGYFATHQYTSGLFVGGAEDGCVFSIGSSGSASYYQTDKFKWGVAPIPGTKVGDEINRAVICQGPSLCMLSQGDEEKDLMTWLFMKELLDPTFQAAFSMVSNYNPSRISSCYILDYMDFLGGNDIKAVTANVARSMIYDYFTLPVFIGSDKVRTQTGAALVNAITGQKSPLEALEEALKKCEE
ncbi:MAG: extracellular solute-binding protein [Anaeroplasmataceae bacterium]|nr:extracellular solute-binding protein [Anaeroplasmataceae bacterium]